MKVILFALFVASANANSGEYCDGCKFVVKGLLEKPADKQHLVDFLKMLCLGNQACLDRVNSISGDITSETPESLCTLVDLCKKPVDKRGGLFDACSTCESQVDLIKSMAGDVPLLPGLAIVADIKLKFMLLCLGKAACTAKVDSVIKELATASSNQICTDIKLL